MSIDVRHDRAAGRFVALVADEEAYLTYRPAGTGLVEYDYTFVPPQHRGHGLGEAIVRHALQYAREHRLRVIPSCGFVRRVAESPEYRGLIAD